MSSADKKTFLVRELESSSSLGIEALADKKAKRILSYRPLHARIVKEIITDLKDVELDRIEQRLGAEFKGHGKNSELLTTENTELSTETGSWIELDLLTSLKLPAENVDLMMNMEIQKRIGSRKSFLHRTTVYSAAMAMHQLGRSIKDGEYKNYRRCVSIWLVFDQNQKQNRIEYRGALPVDGKDDIGIYIVRVAGPKRPGYTGIFRMLGLIFLEKGPLKKRLSILNREYGIPTTKEFTKEITDMLTYAQEIAYTNRKKGKIEGKAEGRKEKESRMLAWMSDIASWAHKTGRSVDFERAGKDADYRSKLTEEALGQSYAEAVGDGLQENLCEND